MSLVEQELLTLPVHLSSPLVISGVRVTRSVVLHVCFVDRYLSFCTFSLAIALSVLLRYIWILITPLISSNSIWARVVQWVRSLDLTAYTSLSPIRRGFAPSFVNYEKGALDSQVISLPVAYPGLVVLSGYSGFLHHRKTGLHDIAEILLKVALNNKNQIKLFLASLLKLFFITRCNYHI